MLSTALFNGDTLADYRSALALASDAVTTAVRDGERPVQTVSPTAMRERLATVDLDAPLAGLGDALEEAGRLYTDHAVWFHHPRYQAHLNCPIAVSALAAEVIASSINTSVDTWDQSLTATLIEEHVLRWLTERLGLGPRAGGVFTSGGTASNLQGLLLARERATPARSDLAALRVFTSPEAHFSVRKAARTLGLAPDAVVLVDVDDRGRLDPTSLDESLTKARAAGLTPMAVVATAGTTDRGAIDPLPQIAQVCRDHRVWMHVDAAVGGALVTSLSRRHLIHGIEQADSVTVDFHKTWYQPLAASALVVRDARTMLPVRLHAEYLNPESTQAPNLVDKSLQTSRRFDAFKVWLTLRTVGPDGIGGWLDTALATTQQAYLAAVRTRYIEAFEAPSTHMLMFRYVDGDMDIDEVNDAIREEMFTRGQSIVARTRHGGQTWLKLTLLNPMTTVADVQDVFDEVVETGRRLSGAPAVRESRQEVSA